MKTTVSTLLLGLLASFSSCIKQAGPEPLITGSYLLTSHTWEVSEAYGSLSGTNYYYDRGVSNNFPSTLDHELLTFSGNGTGIYIDPSSVTHRLTWAFSLSDTTAIDEMIANSGTPTPDTLNLVNVSNTVFSFTSVTPSGIVSYIFIPVP